jgi:four helix bundle protein
MADYRRLVAWQRAYALVLGVYSLTRRFPKDERFGLISPCRRAAVSVAANIAEGAGRSREKEFTHFLWIARGSLTELETEIALSRDLGMLSGEDAVPLLGLTDEVGRLLMGLLKARGAIPNRNHPPTASHDS